MESLQILNGEIFASMLISGANNLRNNRTAIDELNVFPVPDGDTGSNMSLTVGSIVNALNEEQIEGVDKVSSTAAFATLRGARGNSGVITSQIFRGISGALKGKTECDAATFAESLHAGSVSAYKAVMQPTEGTILTVARATGEAALRSATANDDIIKILEDCVASGQKALDNTPNQLPALKEAGVVDAGGQGWMRIVEGMLSYLKTDTVISTSKSAPCQRGEGHVSGEGIPTSKVDANIKFSYCTELLIEKSSANAPVDAFRTAISPIGDCMLVIDDDTIVKVHIHTNDPGFVLSQGVKLGSFLNVKVENMRLQHSEIINQEAEKKKKKKTPTEPEKDFGFVAVSAGKGLDNILTELGVDRVVEGGQTMNPSSQDIAKAVNKVNAASVFVFPNNKNIIMAAQQAKDLCDGKEVIVIPSRSFPECVSAMLSFGASKTIEENKKSFESAITDIKTAQVTFAARDTEYKGHTINKGDILGIIGSDIKYIGKSPEAVCAELVEYLVDDDSEFITIYSGKGVKKGAPENLLEKLEAKYDECEVELKAGGQPLYYYIISVE